MAQTGVISWVDPHGRTGSIQLDQGGELHFRGEEMRDPDLLQVGQAVSFDVVDGLAVNIVAIER